MGINLIVDTLDIFLDDFLGGILLLLFYINLNL